MKSLLIICISIFLTQTNVSSQIISDLNTFPVSELDAVQLPSGSLICTSMEIVPNIGFGYRVLMSRSIDNGNTWFYTETFETDGQYTAIGDPVLALDNEGKPYLLFMSSVNNSLNIHLHLYVSEDDGANWDLVGTPYSAQDFADTPCLIIDEDNTFYISYTEFNTNTILPSVTHVIKSEDAGMTWSEPKFFEPIQSNGSVGSYLSFSNENQLNLIFGDYSLPYTYYTSSNDEGESWSQLIEFPNTIDFAISKIVGHKNQENICVFIHQAHNATSGIHLVHSQDNGLSWDSYFLVEKASMAEGYMGADGNVHLTYNQIEGNQYSLNYIYSTDGGVSFSDPLVVFEAETFSDPLPADLLFITGESQSMILGLDYMFHMTFIDWSDETKAKHLIFEPFDFMTSVQNNTYIESDISLFPNPANDFINLKISSNQKYKSWSIHDMANNTFLEGAFNSITNTEIDVSQLSAGTYFVRLYSENTIVIKRIIVV